MAQNGMANGVVNGLVNGAVNRAVNGAVNGTFHGAVNGSANGVVSRPTSNRPAQTFHAVFSHPSGVARGNDEFLRDYSFSRFRGLYRSQEDALAALILYLDIEINYFDGLDFERLNPEEDAARVDAGAYPGFFPR